MTMDKKKEINDRRQVLAEKLTGWISLRAIYMPALTQYLIDVDEEPAPTSVSASDSDTFKLWLPSSISTASRRAVSYEALLRMEERLRVAQCSDALHGL